MFGRLIGLKTISSRALHRLMQDEPLTAIDVNSPQRWGKAHVPGAINLNPATYRPRDLPHDRGSMLVFYCSNYLCRKAPNAARRAKQMGYNNVHVMSAGISGWLKTGLPTEAG